MNAPVTAGITPATSAYASQVLLLRAIGTSAASSMTKKKRSIAELRKPCSFIAGVKKAFTKPTTSNKRKTVPCPMNRFCAAKPASASPVAAYITPR
jgi:hypothetical protein